VPEIVTTPEATPHVSGAIDAVGHARTSCARVEVPFWTATVADAQLPEPPVTRTPSSTTVAEAPCVYARVVPDGESAIGPSLSAMFAVALLSATLSVSVSVDSGVPSSIVVTVTVKEATPPLGTVSVPSLLFVTPFENATPAM
jgi:hypothetical protein